MCLFSVFTLYCDVIVCCFTICDGLVFWPDFVMLLFVVTHNVCDGLVF